MKLRLFCAGIFGIVVLVSASVSAQWRLSPATGAPRTSSGRVRLDAPTPRTPDGKPDLSGLWQTADHGSLEIEVTVDDPKAHTKPWTAAKVRQRLMPDDELIEFVCAENERSTPALREVSLLIAGRRRTDGPLSRISERYR